MVTSCRTSLTFNNCTLCPHCIYVFCIYLKTNSDLCHLQDKLIGFYSRDEKCLQRGTDCCFLLHDGEHPSSTLDILLTIAHSHHTSAVCWAAILNPSLRQHATQRASSILYYQSFVHSLASLKWNRIRQLKAGIDNRAHPVKPVGVGNEKTKANCFAGFSGLECPH